VRRSQRGHTRAGSRRRRRHARRVAQPSTSAPPHRSSGMARAWSRSRRDYRWLASDQRAIHRRPLCQPVTRDLTLLPGLRTDDRSRPYAIAAELALRFVLGGVIVSLFAAVGSSACHRADRRPLRGAGRASHPGWSGMPCCSRPRALRSGGARDDGGRRSRLHRVLRRGHRRPRAQRARAADRRPGGIPGTFSPGSARIPRRIARSDARAD